MMKNKIRIADQHHHVLIPWSEYRRTVQTPPAVLSLDHHTDVLPAFRDPGRKVPVNGWLNPEAVRKAVQELRHDEHFDWAVQSGLVSSVTVSSHVSATPPARQELIVRCHEGWEDENHVFADPEKYRPLADSVLESWYLRDIFGDVLPDHFILDIDCDYFNTVKSFHPSDRSYFELMLEKASLVTFSREEDWLKILKYPGENFTAGNIIDVLANTGCCPAPV